MKTVFFYFPKRKIMKKRSYNHFIFINLYFMERGWV